MPKRPKCLFLGKVLVQFAAEKTGGMPAAFQPIAKALESLPESQASNHVVYMYSF